MMYQQCNGITTKTVNVNDDDILIYHTMRVSDRDNPHEFAEASHLGHRRVSGNQTADNNNNKMFRDHRHKIHHNHV